MKELVLRSLLSLMLTGLPATARGLVQQTTNTPHETVIDGRWEVKTNTDQKAAIVFEFKKANGVVTGTMIQGGKTTEIKNGTLEGAKLKFETTEPVAGGEPVTTAWTGNIITDGETLDLACAPVSKGQSGAGPSRQMQARRVK